MSGESWLVHLHRSFDETSIGKSSGVYGPSAPMPSERPLRNPALQLSDKFTGQSTRLYGSDLYRFKCQGCHGAFCTGAPPEINSVIDPVRATSASVETSFLRRGLRSPQSSNSNR